MKVDTTTGAVLLEVHERRALNKAAAILVAISSHMPEECDDEFDTCSTSRQIEDVLAAFPEKKKDAPDADTAH
jgi:hypothetical protein